VGAGGGDNTNAIIGVSLAITIFGIRISVEFEYSRPPEATLWVVILLGYYLRYDTTQPQTTGGGFARGYVSNQSSTTHVHTIPTGRPWVTIRTHI